MHTGECCWWGCIVVAIYEGLLVRNLLGASENAPIFRVACPLKLFPRLHERETEGTRVSCMRRGRMSHLYLILTMCIRKQSRPQVPHAAAVPRWNVPGRDHRAQLAHARVGLQNMPRRYIHECLRPPQERVHRTKSMPAGPAVCGPWQKPGCRMRAVPTVRSFLRRHVVLTALSHFASFVLHGGWRCMRTRCVFFLCT